MLHLSFPNESTEYRTARNALLDAEIALRRQLEAVAAQRRALPPGGVVPKDFMFERIGANQRPEQVKLSELFGDYPSILLYSLMYGPDRHPRSEERRVRKVCVSQDRYRWVTYQ